MKDVARVHLGPDMRRGVAELDGEGDVAGGIVVIRYGVDTYGVIQNVKKGIVEKVQAALPEGVELVTTYDRSDLIERSIKNLEEKLVEEMAIVSLVCVVFLWHFRSALVAILTLPLSILLSFVAMRYLGLGSNITSLGGIAIAIGAMIGADVMKRIAAPMGGCGDVVRIGAPDLPGHLHPLEMASRGEKLRRFDRECLRLAQDIGLTALEAAPPALPHSGRCPELRGARDTRREHRSRRSRRCGPREGRAGNAPPMRCLPR